jgi:leader peptidase (prepilin peptidase) / N-methyltransferase
MPSFTDQPAGGGAVLVVAARRRPVVLDALRTVPIRRYVGACAVAVPLLGLAFVRFGATSRFTVAAFFIATLCVLAAIDIAERRVPNRIVLPAAAAVLVAQTALVPDRALEWALSAIGASLALFLPHLVYPAGLGMGDVKLALLLGAALGSAVPAALVIGFLAAAVYALLLLGVHGLAARRRTIPFAPFLAYGGIVALLL